MSLLEKATLITTPTAHSNGTLHSIKGGAVADFDVVRGSAATRVNAEGLIEDISILSGELVTNGDFSNGTTDWTLGTGWSISGGKGSFDEAIGGAGNLTQANMLIVGKTYKLTFNTLETNGGNLAYAFGNNSVFINNIQADTTHVVYGVADDVFLKIRGAGDFVGSIDNISVKEVIDATNIPRIDYTTGEAVVLLEPQSTNLITHSEGFTTSEGWSNTRLTSVPSSAISPDGSLNATKLVEDTNNNSRNAVDSVNATLGATVVGSVFVKKADYDYVMIEIVDNAANVNGGLNAYRVSFDILNGAFNADLSSGSPINPFYNIEDYSNGWYRLSVGLTKKTDAVRADLKIQLVNSNTNGANPTYQGDGVSGTYVWGAQIEALPYATSYIPTSGAIATRLADIVTGAGDVNTFNSTEGVLYAEMAALANDGTNRAIALSDGSTSNVVRFYYSTTDNRIVGSVKSGGATVFVFNNALSIATDFLKVAISYRLNEFKMYVNGTLVFTDTSGNTPIGLNELAFDNGAGNDSFKGKVKALAVFNEALTDSELLCLTTI
jgi:hypothetical protein